MRSIALALLTGGTAAVVLTLLGCATVPAGPSLPALAGSAKSADQFAVDDGRCRAFVAERMGGATPSSAANQTVAGSAVAGAAVGAATGAVIDGSAGAAGGAAVGLLLGTLAGSAAAQGAWMSTQQQFDAGYYACMYATGHRVPVPAYDVARYRAWYESLTPPASATAPADMAAPNVRAPAPPSSR